MAIARIQIDSKFLQGLDAFRVPYSFVSDSVPGFSANDLNPTDFILLDGKDGKEGHPDLWYAKHRLQASPLVKAVARADGMDVADVYLFFHFIPHFPCTAGTFVVVFETFAFDEFTV